MLFNSYAFLLVFLPAALLIVRVVDGLPTWRIPVLIALSLAFYGYWDPRYLALMIPSILVNHLAARAYIQTKRGGIITAAIVANLAVLGAFKYTNFIAQNLAEITGLPFPAVDVALPLGISFFTFHHIMYLVDLRRGKAPPIPLGRYALYICFFPQAIAGPLARWNEVVHQFGGRVFAEGWERRWAVGIGFIIVGLAAKLLLADPLGRAIDPIYARSVDGPIADGSSWMALAFAFQVFFDFAGYSDIAIGLGLLLGVQLPRNFDAPFRTTSMIEFWQRWHMTLARFLRDYVFTPLSRARVGGSRQRWLRALVAILLTMGLCGLWHGAGWTYVLWGFSQGVAIVVAALWGRYLPSLPAVIAWAATVGFFLFSIVLFRAPSLEAAWRIYEGLAVLPSANAPGLRTFALAAFCAIVLPASHVIVARVTEAPRRAVAVATALVSIVALLEVGRVQNHEFIYFQF
jgi:D-alanyl-lipoteichoic acid acyltransferase DltB (MBOAT superfamily)